MSIALERRMVDEAMDSWRPMSIGERQRMMDSIRRAIKRFKQRRAAAREMDELAADVALWLGHELLFSDGEKNLIKGPSREDLLRKTAG